MLLYLWCYGKNGPALVLYQSGTDIARLFRQNRIETRNVQPTPTATTPDRDWETWAPFYV